MKGEAFKPDPLLHSDPEILARCPVCNPKPKPEVPSPEEVAIRQHAQRPPYEYCTTGLVVPMMRRRR